ncbi:phosphotransferase enzyme family protein [Streptomyces sp. 4N509B]|uniref:phosphotransferase enzyme family protein n=1 Tax=Streptomyces sp. 4N509B TaxID=3457413 RepID=UPI003FD03C89
MAFAATPLSRPVVDAVVTAWGHLPDLPARRPDEDDAWRRAVRLHGGEESAAFRLRELVVRVGPRGRSREEAEWCHAVARRAAGGGVSEAVAPVPTRHGGTVVSVGGRPVSLWPYVEGGWADRDDPTQRVEAARLLGRLHRALLSASLSASPPLPARPVPSPLEIGPDGRGRRGRSPRSEAALAEAGLVDDALDRWLAAFHARHPLTHPLHGDYYRGNLLARHGHVVAVLDWDEALVGPPALEVATAAREFGDPWTTDLRGAGEFVAAYAAAGGTAGRLDEEALAQLVRHRLRCEASLFWERAAAGGGGVDPLDAEYQRRRIELFRSLRP